MTFDLHVHHRRTIRLQEYDYSSEGFYFVTICVQKHECLLGEIAEGEIWLNDAEQMIKKWYHKTSEKISNIACHEMVIMPNHFHCIWQITDIPVGADPRVRPNNINKQILQ